MAKHIAARAVFQGTTIAASERAIVVEGRHYFPEEDVRMDLLEPCSARSLCPWKGVASYYSVQVGDARGPGAAWTYKHPSPLARRVRGRIAFRDAVEVAPAD